MVSYYIYGRHTCHRRHVSPPSQMAHSDKERLSLLTRGSLFQVELPGNSSLSRPTKRCNFRTREPQCVHLWFFLSCVTTRTTRRHVSLADGTLGKENHSMTTCDYLFQSQSPQVVVVMSNSQTEISDKRAKILYGLGATQMTIGILEVLFNIGASIMWAHVADFIGGGYWCGIFVSHEVP